MKDKGKSKEILLDELVKLRQRIAELELSKTKLEQVDKTLREFEKKHKALVDQSILGIVVVQDFRIVFANNAFAKITGYTIKELFSFSPEKVKSLVHPEDQGLVWGRFKGRLEGKSLPPHYQYRGIRKDGSVRWLEMYANRIDYNDKPAIQGAIIDITERQLTEIKLIESESKLKGILSSMVDLVFAFDKEGKFIFFHSPQLEDLYVPPKRFVGKRHSEVMPPHINRLFKEAFRKNKRGEIAEYEYWLKIKGKLRWFVAKLSPLFVDIKFVGSVAVVREITAQKQAAEELKRYRDHLKELVTGCTAELRKANEQLKQEISRSKIAQDRLSKSESNLHAQKLALEQKNIALREVIAQIEMEKKRVEKDIETNINVVISPILERLKKQKISAKLINLIKHHLEKLTSPYGTKITEMGFRLTPREIEICNLLKSGLTSKDISNILNISYRTVEKHRRNIRSKIGISKKHINLTSFLREL